jgi:succinoglycan biosynthesis protein ExoM
MIETSILIPSYRRPELLARALGGCLAQEGAAARYEIVIIDNDAEGSARAVVEAAATTTAVPLRYIVESRPGISHARNTGIAAAAGRYVAFLDDDEEPVPGWLAAFLSTIREFDADAVVGPVRPCFPASAGEVDAYRRKFYTRDAGVATGTILSVWAGIGNALLDKEQCFGSLPQPFDPHLGLSGGEDTVFLRQLVRRGLKLVWCAEAAASEGIPLEKLASRYLLRRAFRGAQTTTFACAAVRPPELGRAALWMALGCAQAALYTPLALALRAVKHERWLAVAAKAVGGFGKVFWHPMLHLRMYR